jgi:hypothetical protein
MQSDIGMSSCTPHHRVPLATNRRQGPFRSILVDLVLLRHVRIHQECGPSQCMACASVISLAASLYELMDSGTSFPFCTFPRYFTSYWRTSTTSNPRMVKSYSGSKLASAFYQRREEYTESHAGLTGTYSTYHCPHASSKPTQH